MGGEGQRSGCKLSSLLLRSLRDQPQKPAAIISTNTASKLPTLRKTKEEDVIVADEMMLPLNLTTEKHLQTGPRKASLPIIVPSGLHARGQQPRLALLLILLPCH